MKSFFKNLGLILALLIVLVVLVKIFLTSILISVGILAAIFGIFKFLEYTIKKSFRKKEVTK